MTGAGHGHQLQPGEAQSSVQTAPCPHRQGHRHGKRALTNSHFLAIPSMPPRAGAKVVVNFLLSPAAQAGKSDPAFWGGSQRAAPGGAAWPDPSGTGFKGW